MIKVRDIAGVKLAPKSIFHSASWSSGDEMAKEASEHEEYLGGTATKLPNVFSQLNCK